MCAFSLRWVGLRGAGKQERIYNLKSYYCGLIGKQNMYNFSYVF